MTIQQALAIALQHHESGRLAEAEAIYRQILAVEPQHADALHFLGVIAYQAGKHLLAVDLIRQAIVLRPENPAPYDNLGSALRAQGNFDDAIAAHRQAIALQPEKIGAHYNLGSALRAKGLVNEAIAAYRKAISLNPGYCDAHNNLGNALKDVGRLDEAIAAYREAVSLRPTYPEAYCNLGNALTEKGQLDEAIAASRHAIALNANLPEAWFNLGQALYGAGQFDEAIDACRQAIALKPNYPEAYNNVGNAFKKRGDLNEAIAAYRQSIALKPNSPEPYSNLGTALNDQSKLEEAIAAFRQAIALRPELPEPRSNLGSALKNQGRLDEAIAAYRQAVALNPGLAPAHSDLLLTFNYHPGCDERALAEERQRWNQQHAEPLRPFIRPHPNERNPDRRLRVGYVSPDFRDHSVAYFLEGLLASHDSTRVEAFCYANVSRPDAVTARLRQLVTHWQSIIGMQDAAVAELIRQHRIDILVDLAGHTAQSRILIFARKPAPVQLTWLGYPGSTGLETMDYRLTDALADPLGIDEYPPAEPVLRLPECAWCFRPSATSPAVTDLPVHHAGHLTFGCFNAHPKINLPLLQLWADILRAVPASRLLLKNSSLLDPSTRQLLHARFKDAGIGLERVELAVHSPTLGEHLATYGRVDIALDTFPYHGTTTTCEALWMGVPVVTLAGTNHVSRVGVSLLSNAGLPELVAASPQQYVTIATALAADVPRLSQLRSTLRQRMAGSPLLDAPRFARDVEAAYREIWRRWCDNKR